MLKMRKLDNWLESYIAYTDNTESSSVFNKWVGISTIASALRKKTWLNLGRLKVYPNMYIVLVADPGIARKSQAITYATDIISQVPSIILSADSLTSRALMDSLEESICYDRLPNGDPFRHASLSVISKEFESFLGGGGSKIMVTLTDLFDAGENPWKHRTSSSGSSTLPAVYLNILGATTPKSLETCLSELTIGGGLSSRIIFVCSEMKSKKVAIPEMTENLLTLRSDLVTDLQSIANIIGEFNYTEDGLKYWKEWYEAYDETGVRKNKQQEFTGWYSRKPLMLQKLSVILSASRTNDKLITPSIIDESLELLEEIETSMHIAIKPELRKSTRQSELLLRHIKQHEIIEEKYLLQLIWRDISIDVFDSYIDELILNGDCKREFVNPDGIEEGIWYRAIK